MSWHQIPKDDAWKRVTLAHVASLGQRIWLRCKACAHEQYQDPLAFAAFHDVDPATPQLIAPKLLCTVCGEHKTRRLYRIRRIRSSHLAAATLQPSCGHRDALVRPKPRGYTFRAPASRSRLASDGKMPP
jgi:hypothetical protein